MRMRNFLAALFLALTLVVAVAPVAPSYVHAAEESEASADPDTTADANDPSKQTLPATPGADDGSGAGFIVTALTPVMTFFAWLMGVAALALDASIYYTVIQMGETLNPNQYAAVGVTWRILRDIGNIILIFGFLAIGISIILGNEIIGYGQKMLPRLLIAAVALNFSLFAAEAVVDVGNLFATQIYAQINGGVLPVATAGDFLEKLANQGVGQKVFAVFGFQTFYGDAAQNAKLFTGDNQLLISFMAIAVFLVAAFVFFSLAFMFVARFVYLIGLIITSPIGVAGFAMPKLESAARQWWDALFKQTVTAPILLLGLYVALMVITDDLFLQSFGAQSHGWTVAIGSGAGADDSMIGMILSFVVAMALLLGVMVLSKKIGAAGADTAMKWGGRLSFGATSLAGRATLGNVGNVMASKRVQALARRSSVLGYAAKTSSFLGKGLRSSTYDIRNVPGVVALPGKYGVDVGRGASYSAKQAWDQVDRKYGTKTVRKWFEESAAEREQAGREIDFKDAQTAIRNNRNMRDQGIITDDEMRKLNEEPEKKLKDSLSKMSIKQLEELDGIKDGVEELVKNLSPQQFEALLKSDKLNDTQKGNLKRTRYLDFEKAVNDGDVGRIKKTLGAFSKGELEAIPSSLLANENVLDQLSDKQRETLTDSKERTAAEKDAVRNSSRTGKIESEFKKVKQREVDAGVPEAAAAATAAAAVAAHADFSKLTVAQVAKLDKEILTQKDVAETLTPAHLTSLQEEKKLSGAEISEIANHIRTSLTSKPATKAFITTGPGAAYWV